MVAVSTRRCWPPPRRFENLLNRQHHHAFRSLLLLAARGSAAFDCPATSRFHALPILKWDAVSWHRRYRRASTLADGSLSYRRYLNGGKCRRFHAQIEYFAHALTCTRARIHHSDADIKPSSNRRMPRYGGCIGRFYGSRRAPQTPCRSDVIHPRRRNIDKLLKLVRVSRLAGQRFAPICRIGLRYLSRQITITSA